jgi:serine/threonine protein kinase
MSEYTPICPIGDGTYGEVDLYLHATGELRAIKFSKIANDAKCPKYFNREIDALAHFRHPACVRFFGWGVHRERCCIALEYVPGGNLHDFLFTRQAKKAPLDLACVLTILLGVARCVAAMHAQGMIHRDLKPTNILLNSRREPFVADFGFARRVDALSDLTPAIGSCRFIPPEVLRGPPYGYKADVWSFGMLAYSTVTGELPYHELKYECAVIAAITNGQMKPSIGADHPLAALLGDCLFQDDAGRPTMAQCAEAIVGIAEKLGLQSVIDYDRTLEKSEWQTEREVLVEVQEAVKDRRLTAMCALGVLLCRGILMEKNRDEGLRLLGEASDMGSEEAILILDEIDVPLQPADASSSDSFLSAVQDE